MTNKLYAGLGVAAGLVLALLASPVRSQNPSLVFGSSSGVAQVIKSTSNALWVTLTTTLGVASGGTGATTLTNHGVLVGSGTSAIAAMAVCGTGTLVYGQVGANPVCSTTTWPNSATQGDLLTATGANAFGSVTAVATGQLLASAGTGTVPAYSATPSITSITVKAGTSSDTLKAGGVLNATYTTTDTATQNTWNVATVALAANQFATNGDLIRIQIGLLSAANTNTHEYQLYYALASATCSGSGATLCDSGCAIMSSKTETTSSGHTVLYADLFRRTASNSQAYTRSTQGVIASQQSSTCSVDGTAATVIALGWRNTSASAATIGSVAYTVSYFGK